MAGLQRMCKFCGRNMPITPFMTCNQCLEDMEKIKAYIQRNSRVNAMELAMNTNVSIEKITKMIKMGSILQKTY